jgi:multiple sugar transport system permease protein
MKFSGLKNYSEIFGSVHFWQSLRFTLAFVAVTVILEMFLGMLFALVLNEKSRFRGFLMAALLIPWAIPVAISARVWQLMYNYDYGVFNFLIEKFAAPVNWLGSSTGAFFSIVMSDVWKTTPFVTIILLAGLSAIPREVYEQAMVDGANFFQGFLKITLPLLRPVILVALLFRTIDSMRVFDIIYVLTGGGPAGSTTSLSLYAYQHFLAGNFGYGAGVSVIIFLIALGFSILYIRFGKFTEGAE